LDDRGVGLYGRAMLKPRISGSIAALVLTACTTTPAAPPPAPPPPENDTVGPDACFGVRTGAVVVTYDASSATTKVLGTDTSSDELSSVARCLTAYVTAHPPAKAGRVLFRHPTKDAPPETVSPAPDGRAKDLVP